MRTAPNRQSGLAACAALFLGWLLVAPTSVLIASDTETEVPAWSGGPLEVAWSDDAGRCVELPLVPSGDHLFVTTTDRKLFCYDLGTGEKVWKRRFKTDLATAPAVLDGPETAEGSELEGGRLFLQVGVREDAKLYAFRADDGDEVWKLPSFPRATQLEADDASLFLLDLAGNLQRIDPVDGSPVWDRSGLGWDAPGFLLESDTIFALARKDSLVALDRETGATRFGSYVPGFFSAAPQLDGDRILAATTEGRLFAISIENGAVKELGRHRSLQLAPPLGFGDRVLTVSSDGWVEASADSVLWTEDLGEAVRGTPTAVSGLCFVPTSAGRLVALRADTGAQVWSLELGDRLSTAPLFTERFLVVATNRGDVYAYEH